MRAPWVLLLAVVAPSLAHAEPDGAAPGGARSLVPFGATSRVLCGAATAGWQAPDFDDAAWTVATPPPNDAPPLDAAPTVAGSLDMAPPPPCVPLRARYRFDAPVGTVGEAAARLASLTLRARYHDGFVAWLNGVEVARRRVAEGSPDDAPATEPHGGEAEALYLAAAPSLLRPTGNVLAVEVRAARPTRRPLVDVALDGADGPRVVRGPMLQGVTTRDAWLYVDSDLPTRVTVEWAIGAAPAAIAPTATTAHREPIVAGPRALPATGGALAATAPLPSTTRGAGRAVDAAATRHVLHLTGLAAATSYHYRLVAAAPDAASLAAAPITVDAEFHTPPDASHPLRFVVLGDVRSGHDVHAAIVRAVAAEDPDLVLMTGDLVDTGSDEAEWQRYFEIEAPLLRQVALYVTAGNHEYARKGRGADRWRELFLRGSSPTESGPTWWSFDVAGVHFVAVDSQAYADPAQLAWVERDLATARQRRARAIVVFAHDGPWSSMLHGDNALAVRDYAPIYARYRASVVFSGHDHDYERGRVGAVDYVVTGGGGAELRTPRCGVPGRKPCPPRMAAFANEHHYVLVELDGRQLRLTPKRPDGTLLEPTVTLPLR